MVETTTGVILAAGRGKRLDITDTIKPLIRINNEPLIIRTIKSMQNAGIDKIHIVVG